MTIWWSQVRGTVKTDDAVEVGVQTAILNSDTDANGIATFDLSGLSVTTLIDASARILGQSKGTLTENISESVTEVQVQGLVENNAVVVAGEALEPFIAIGEGVTIRLTVQYK